MVLKNISETLDFLIIEIDKACESLYENPDFKGRVDILQNIKSDEFSHDNIFHTFLGLFGIETKEYDKNLDIFKRIL